MATYFSQPVSEQCCEPPCERESPCEDCCECPEVWGDCLACPHDLIGGYLGTLSVHLTEDVADWTWTDMTFNLSAAPACRFIAGSDQSSPCTIGLIIQFSTIYGWQAQATGSCITSPTRFWGSPIIGCNDSLESAHLYKDGDSGADVFLVISA